MTLEELMEAFEKKTPVTVCRFKGYEPPLHFDHIRAIIPAFDQHGQPDYNVVLVDSVGRPVTVKASTVSIG